jgi:hypothetical protein
MCVTLKEQPTHELSNELRVGTIKFKFSGFWDFLFSHSFSLLTKKIEKMSIEIKNFYLKMSYDSASPIKMKEKTFGQKINSLF